MPLITLLSDWGTKDHYLAEVKLKLHALLPDWPVLDISHDLDRGDILSAAYMMYNLLPSFPPGSLHLLGVDDIGEGTVSQMVARSGEQYFIGADNGFFHRLRWFLGQAWDEVWEIGIKGETGADGNECLTFPTRDLYPKVASILAGGYRLEQVGMPGELHLEGGVGSLASRRQAVKDRSGTPVGIWLSGAVLYMDRFGNVVSSIRHEDFEECRCQYPYTYMMVNGKKDSKLPGRTYRERAPGLISSLFLKNGFLEVSICDDHAGNLLGLNKNSQINILFGSAG